MVLDPFSGTGTTLVAARILGRNGIGFELDRKYKDEFCRRIDTEGLLPESVFDELQDDQVKADWLRKALNAILASDSQDR